MMDKSKLLITMGCSLTEGVGCWDLKTIPKNLNKSNFQNSILYREIFIKNMNRFHELGWPNRVGKKLGYDEVINIGTGASSNSGQLKLFIEKYLNGDFSDYEVLVIWYLTEPARFSFYVDGYNKNFSFNTNTPIESAYLNLINNSKDDTLLEQIFYMKCMEQICENKGYNLLFTYWSDSNKNINSYYNSKYLLSPTYTPILPIKETIENSNMYYSEICNHPNENGYEIISDRIFDEIKKNHPYIITSSPKEKIKWKWDGYHKWIHGNQKVYNYDKHLL